MTDILSTIDKVITNKLIINDIFNKLTELREWWMGKSYMWFSGSTFDETITHKYIKLFNNVTKYILQEMLFADIVDFKVSVGYIILKDQISRHLTRYLGVDLVDDNIFRFADIFYKKNHALLHGHDFCFTLLPLRHSNIFCLQEYAAIETWKKLNSCTNDNKNLVIYRKYLKATYERMSEKDLDTIDLNLQLTTNFANFASNFADILDINIQQYTDTISLNYVCNNLKILCDGLNITEKIILSISGGADSMMLSWALYKLGYDFVMVNINYANRPVCIRESEFLVSWAKFLNKEIFIKDINEINRPNCMKYNLRELYENYTKNVRYLTYIQAKDYMGWEQCSVVLGHNYDDCFENILTNITNKQHYENLNGMKFMSEIKFKNDNIIFYRPMLTIQKSYIYELAHENRIPYFQDSTPKWSQRGKIRDIVKPALKSWNVNVINSLHALPQVLSDSMECVNILANDFIDKLVRFADLDNECAQIQSTAIPTVELNNYKFNKCQLCNITINKTFWTTVLSKLTIKTSAKSMNNLILKLSEIKITFDKFNVNKLNSIMINSCNIFRYWKINENTILLGFNTT